VLTVDPAGRPSVIPTGLRRNRAIRMLPPRLSPLAAEAARSQGSPSVAAREDHHVRHD